MSERIFIFNPSAGRQFLDSELLIVRESGERESSFRAFAGQGLNPFPDYNFILLDSDNAILDIFNTDVLHGSLKVGLVPGGRALS